MEMSLACAQLSVRHALGRVTIEPEAVNMQSGLGSTRALACSDRRLAGRNEGVIQSLNGDLFRCAVWSARAPTTAREGACAPHLN